MKTLKSGEMVNITDRRYWGVGGGGIHLICTYKTNQGNRLTGGGGGYMRLQKVTKAGESTYRDRQKKL
jgi:hypothetical protein